MEGSKFKIGDEVITIDLDIQGVVVEISNFANHYQSGFYYWVKPNEDILKERYKETGQCYEVDGNGDVMPLGYMEHNIVLNRQKVRGYKLKELGI